MKSLAELEEIRKRTLDQINLRTSNHDIRVLWVWPHVVSLPEQDRL